jgi:integrase
MRLINSGMPLPAISERSGHANPELTLRIYSHAFKKDGVRLASEFDFIAKTVLEVVPTANRSINRATDSAS